MKLTAIVCLGAMLSAAPAFAGQQKPIKPSSPATVGSPVWSHAVHMPDGRTFVTDGGMAIDADVARPAVMPEVMAGSQGGALLTRHMSGPREEEVGLTGLRAGPFENTFATPKGVAINGNYVTFLRGVGPASRIRLRAQGTMDPIVIVLDGKSIGVLMPVRR